tara:strand:+ start:3365 stop:4069 length:705 start_codon:yes stop_codon:yes gene_type:complete
MDAISAIGEKKTGKTTFACSAPKPIHFFDFEGGIRRVEPRFVPEPNKITVKTYIGDYLEAKVKKGESYLELWNRIISDYNASLEDPNVASIVFDTAATVWEIRRNAELVTVQKFDPDRKILQPPEYTPCNTDMKVLIQQAAVHKKKLVLVHHTKEEWKAGKPTGVMVADGFSYTGDHVDLELRFKRGIDVQSKKTIPIATIETAGLSMAAFGVSINEPTWDKVDQLIENFRKIP